MDIGQISGAISAVVFGGGAVLGLVRLNMRGAFTSLSAHSKLEQRVDAMEDRMQRGPNQQDLNAMSIRLADVERGVGVMGATLGGVRDAMTRVEHMTDLLLKSSLQGEKRGT